MLEQMQVPIDVIAGTSMGTIVGRLYASGMGATELVVPSGRFPASGWSRCCAATRCR